MIENFSQWIGDLIALVYPRNCAGCGRSLSKGEEILCTICKFNLPKVGLHDHASQKFLSKFYGKIQVDKAFAFLHFHKEGITQHILHNLKYRNQPLIGEKLGEWFGADLANAGLAENWDLIIPIPLHRSKEKRRGYNQSKHFAIGIGTALNIPTSFDAVTRERKSETQTHKSKQERWENVEGIFSVRKPDVIRGKSLLLVDDVVTTGATLESCGQTLMESGARKLSMATLAIAH